MPPRRPLLRSVALLVLASLIITIVAACNAPRSGGNAGAGPQLAVASDGENLRFDPVQLTAAPEQEVSLTFSNHARSLRHNWVLVDGGKEIADQVYAAGQAAGLDHDFVPADHPSVLAATEQRDGGESTTTTFTTPATPGDYFYICTTPGHYLAGMHGVLTIK